MTIEETLGNDKKRKFRMFKKRVTPLNIYEEAEISKYRINTLLEGKNKATIERLKQKPKNNNFNPVEIEHKEVPISSRPLVKREENIATKSLEQPISENLVDKKQATRTKKATVYRTAVSSPQEPPEAQSTRPVPKKSIESELDFIIKSALENPNFGQDEKTVEVDPQLLQIVQNFLLESNYIQKKPPNVENEISQPQNKLENLFESDNLNVDSILKDGSQNSDPRTLHSQYPIIQSDEEESRTKEQIKNQILELLENSDREDTQKHENTSSGLQELENQLKGSLEKIKMSKKLSKNENNQNQQN